MEGGGDKPPSAPWLHERPAGDQPVGFGARDYYPLLPRRSKARGDGTCGSRRRRPRRGHGRLRLLGSAATLVPATFERVAPPTLSAGLQVVRLSGFGRASPLYRTPTRSAVGGGSQGRVWPVFSNLLGFPCVFRRSCRTSSTLGGKSRNFQRL